MLAVFIELFGDKITSMLILFGTLIILLFITSIREGIGTDFYNYKDIYNDIILNKIYDVEFGFIFLNYLAFYLGGFKILLLITSFLNLFSIGYILWKWRLNISIGFLTYYSLFYFNHNFNVVRHGLMSSLVWLGLYFFSKREKLKSILLYFFSFLIHKTAIIIYPIQYITKKKISLLWSYCILIIFYFVGSALNDYYSLLNLFINSYYNTSNKLDYYLNDYNKGEIVKYKFGLGFLLYVIIYSLISKSESFFKNKDQIIFFNRILFIAISIFCLFSSFSILSERVGNTLLLTLIFIFSSFANLNMKKTNKVIVLFLIFCVNIFYLLTILHLPGFDREYQFLPYTFSLTF